MKVQVQNYVFDKAAGTVTFSDYVSIRLDSVLLITNVTSNVIVYNFADATKGGAVVNNVLTLDYNTSAMARTDNLQIYYDDAANDLDITQLPSRDQMAYVNYQLDEEVGVIGDSGPLQQHEKEAPLYPSRELMTFDSNLHTIFGSQNLVNGQRLKVEDSLAPEQTVDGLMGWVNAEVRINLTGQGTTILQLWGTWAGTVSFYGAVDGNTWVPIYGESLTVGVGGVSATANGILRFATAGILALRCQFTTYTSGIARARWVSTALATTKQNVFPLGSQTQLVQQRGTTYEQLTYDTSTAPSVGLMKDALQTTDYWNPKGVYYVGDTCMYNGQVYQCIQATTTNYYVPTNTTYWQVDQRQNKSLVATVPASPPGASRVRVEIDLDAYQIRLAEDTMVSAKKQAWADLEARERQLYAMQGQGGQNGVPYALGMSGGSYYTMDEIR